MGKARRYLTDLRASLKWLDAAHDNDRHSATASAILQAFQPEVLAQLHKPKPKPMSEIVILGAHHEGNLGERVVEYDEPRTVRLQVLLEDYQDTYGRTERRLAACEPDDSGERTQQIGYLPKDAPRQTGTCLAVLQRQEGKRRIEGRLSPLQERNLAPREPGPPQWPVKAFEP